MFREVQIKYMVVSRVNSCGVNRQGVYSALLGDLPLNSTMEQAL